MMNRIPDRDLWGSIFNATFVCSWLGHSYTVSKMSGRVCHRCRAFRRYR